MTDKLAEFEAAWDAATAEERGKFLEQLAAEMGQDAFFEMLIDAFGEEELRAELERLKAH